MERKGTERKPSIKGRPNSDFIPRVQLAKQKRDEESRKKELKPQPRPNPFLMANNQMKRKLGGGVLREIKTLQSTTGFLLPKASFERMVRGICQNNFEDKVRWTSMGMDALQTGAESYMVGLFEDSYLCALHAKRDMQLARRIRGLEDPGNR